MEDITQIAHRWYHFCKQMRLNPQKYWKMTGPDGQPGGTSHDLATGDAYVGHGGAPWISEMYGYVFSSAEAGLTHILTDGEALWVGVYGMGSIGWDPCDGIYWMGR